jgi:hypothetical protein
MDDPAVVYYDVVFNGHDGRYPMQEQIELTCVSGAPPLIGDRWVTYRSPRADGLPAREGIRIPHWAAHIRVVQPTLAERAQRLVRKRIDEADQLSGQKTTWADHQQVQRARAELVEIAQLFPADDTDGQLPVEVLSPLASFIVEHPDDFLIGWRAQLNGSVGQPAVVDGESEADE